MFRNLNKAIIMTLSKNLANGHHPKLLVLAAVGAREATPNFGSQNVATTASASDCRIDVISELFPVVLEELQHSGKSSEPVTTDRLDLGRLSEAVLAELAPLWQADAAIEASERVQSVLESAKQRRALDTTAQIHDAVTRTVSAAVDEIRTRIHRLADGSPATLRTTGLDLIRLLMHVKPAVQDCAQSIQYAVAAIERAHAVASRAASFAESDRPFIVGQQQDWARRCVRKAFQALIEEFVARELASQCVTLTDAAQSLVNLAGEALGRIDEVKRKAAEWASHERLILIQPPCTTILTLSGTLPDEAIAGLLERHRFAGRNELSRYLLDRWLIALRTFLRDRVLFNPDSVGAFQVLAAVPPATAFELFRALLEGELQPEVLTVYGRLRQFGIRSALQLLVDRSGLTSDPGPRGSTRFKLNVYRILIVSLPETVQPGDHEVRRQVVEELAMLDQIELTEHAASFDEIVIHQIGGGWPWQILPSNRHLRDQHLAAADAGHRSHLVHIFPESPTGDVVTHYRTLKSHEENGHGS